MQPDSPSNQKHQHLDALSEISIAPLRETFPALHLARTSRVIRTVGKLTFIVLVLSLIAMFFAPWQQTSRRRDVHSAITIQALNRSAIRLAWRLWPAPA